MKPVFILFAVLLTACGGGDPQDSDFEVRRALPGGGTVEEEKK